MSDEKLETCTYRILRYTPNLVRDEWLNIGVLLFHPPSARLRVRLLEEEGGLARIRRLHPQADIGVLRALQSDIEAQASATEGGAGAYLAKLEDTLSNVLQLGPQKAVLTADADLEIDRLYRDHIEPPRYQLPGGADREYSRGTLRMRAADVFRRTGIWGQMDRGVRVDQFTTPGDPFRLDYSYRKNGTLGYLHALPLGRDTSQAKVLAYTADCIRAKNVHAEFAAVTEVAPQPDNQRHAFVAGLLESQKIALVPISGLDKYARELRVRLM
jgi:hypothetical protein